MSLLLSLRRFLDKEEVCRYLSCLKWLRHIWAFCKLPFALSLWGSKRFHSQSCCHLGLKRWVCLRVASPAKVAFDWPPWSVPALVAAVWAALFLGKGHPKASTLKGAAGLSWKTLYASLVPALAPARLRWGGKCDVQLRAKQNLSQRARKIRSCPAHQPRQSLCHSEVLAVPDALGEMQRASGTRHSFVFSNLAQKAN